MTPTSREIALPGGQTVRIERVPQTGAGLLPWSAADEYVLRTLAGYLGEVPGGASDEPADELADEPAASAAETAEVRTSPAPPAVEPGEGRPLVLGDSFGLLTVALALAGRRPIHVTDSALAQSAARINLENNGVDPSVVTFVDLAQSPDEISDPISLVVMKISKSVQRMKYEIGWVRTRLTADTKVIVSGMTKHLSPNTRKILEEHWGTTTTSRVHKKSILFFVEPREFEMNEKLVSSVSYSVDLGLAEPAVLESFPGVFSQDRMDVGTRLLLESLPEELPKEATIIDLGCGNGILMLLLKLREPSLKVHGVEDSFLALASAERNFDEHNVEAESLEIADGVESFEPESADWIVTNPPFHAATALNMEEAARHFRPAAKVLRPGGKLFVVGTHGVDYSPVLRSIFATVRSIGKNKRFRAFQCDGSRFVRRDGFERAAQASAAQTTPPSNATDTTSPGGAKPNTANPEPVNENPGSVDGQS